MAIVSILVLAVVLGWARSCSVGRFGSAENRGNTGHSEQLSLGAFEVTSGKVAVTDPGYSRALVLEGKVAKLFEDVQTGSWRADLLKRRFPGASAPILMELQAYHKSVADPKALPWQDTQRHAAHSGHAGIFDWEFFQRDDAVPKNYQWRKTAVVPTAPWYSLCVDQTINDKQAGVLMQGVVSSCNLHMANYSVYQAFDSNGRTIALKLVFFNADDY